MLMLMLMQSGERGRWDTASQTKEVRASSEQDSRVAERSKTSESTHRHSLILTLTQNSSTIIISLQAACFRVPLSDELSQGSPCEAKVLGTCFSHGVPCITRQCQHAPETSCLSSRHESQRAYAHITLISSFAIPSRSYSHRHVASARGRIGHASRSGNPWKGIFSSVRDFFLFREWPRWYFRLCPLGYQSQGPQGKSPKLSRERQRQRQRRCPVRRQPGSRLARLAVFEVLYKP